MIYNNFPIVLRCSKPDEDLWIPLDRCAQICEPGEPLLEGYAAWLVTEDIKHSYPNDPRVFSVSQQCRCGDFLLIDENEEQLRTARIIAGDRDERTLFLTERCNSNCIMCPYGSKHRSRGIDSPVGTLLQFIELMDPNCNYICITGGEPTLLKQDFLQILASVKEHLKYATVHILTNGRSLSYSSFFQAYRQVRPYQTLLGIPLHASNADLHDHISGICGSFAQTVKGLDRCYSAGEHIELRIVTSALNASALPALAEFIGRRYPAVDHVSLMGLEMMGNAMINRRDVWISFDALWPYVEQAVDILLRHGVSTRLFNYPLCMVSERFQPLYSKSITGYKIRYKPECDNCLRKQLCGGFFQTTIVMPDITVKPYC